MGILGDVNNGWFAKLAHGCEYVSKATLNGLSFGGRLGDRLYSNMTKVADAHVEKINQQAIDKSLKSGATQFQALSAGSAAMEQLANPKSASELGSLFSVGSGISLDTVKSMSPSILGLLTPLLIGAGALGGIYLLADNLGRD